MQITIVITILAQKSDTKKQNDEIVNSALQKGNGYMESDTFCIVPGNMPIFPDVVDVNVDGVWIDDSIGVGVIIGNSGERL